LYQEKYVKHIVTDLEDKNELVLFVDFVLGNYFLESDFGNFEEDISPFKLENNLNSFTTSTRSESHTIN